MAENTNTVLDAVKISLGITGNYLDNTLTAYIEEVTSFLKSGGISETTINQNTGLIARGVTDLWNYGNTQGRFSTYFFQRARQLIFEEGEN